jgi:hypothetical protein
MNPIKYLFQILSACFRGVPRVCRKCKNSGMIQQTQPAYGFWQPDIPCDCGLKS